MSAFLQANRNIDSDKLGNALIQMVEENLNMKGWNFNLAFTNFTKKSSLVAIYDSEWCRISFIFSQQHTPQYDELSIEYGRLHALNEEPYVEWEGELCHCWHNVNDPLRFLDGLSISEAVQQAKIQKESPAAVENFRKSEFGKRLFNKYPPKASIVMHSVLWEHYGQRLFELFDLRRPDLWEKYRRFIKEYYGLLGMKASYGPQYENIC